MTAFIIVILILMGVSLIKDFTDLRIGKYPVETSFSKAEIFLTAAIQMGLFIWGVYLIL